MSEGQGDSSSSPWGSGDSVYHDHETAKITPTPSTENASEDVWSSQADDPGLEDTTGFTVLGPADVRTREPDREPSSRSQAAQRYQRDVPKVRGFLDNLAGQRPGRSGEPPGRNGEPGRETSGGGYRPAEEAQRTAETSAEPPGAAGEEIKSTSEPGQEAGSGGYRPAEEAQQAGEVVTELLGDTREGINELIREHESAIAQTAGLAQAIDRLTAAVDALTRTVAALMEELKAGRSAGSLGAVAVIQKPVADSAAEEAVSAAASAGVVQRALRAIVAKLDRIGEWLWSMIIHLVTIREWSLGGKMKIPGIAEASINVTFGG
jgi:hypothetical protein